MRDATGLGASSGPSARLVWQRRLRTRSRIAAAGLVTAVVVGFVVAWHDVPAAVDMMFSNPMSRLLEPSGYNTCTIGNFGGAENHALVHHWKYLSRAGGPVTLRVTAISVNSTDAGGEIKAIATHKPSPSGATTSSISAAHSGTKGPAGYVSATMTVPTEQGVTYDLTVASVRGPFGPSGHHYRVGVAGPDAHYVELGYGDPALEYLEPGLSRWAVNAGPGEEVTLELVVDAHPASGAPPDPFAVEYSVLDPDGSAQVVASEVVLRPGSASEIGFPNAAATARTYILKLYVPAPGGHFKLVKSSGPDRGLYALDCSRGNTTVLPTKERPP